MIRWVTRRAAVCRSLGCKLEFDEKGGKVTVLEDQGQYLTKYSLWSGGDGSRWGAIHLFEAIAVLVTVRLGVSRQGAKAGSCCL